MSGIRWFFSHLYISLALSSSDTILLNCWDFLYVLVAATLSFAYQFNQIPGLIIWEIALCWAVILIIRILGITKFVLLGRFDGTVPVPLRIACKEFSNELFLLLAGGCVNLGFLPSCGDGSCLLLLRCAMCMIATWTILYAASIARTRHLTSWLSLVDSSWCCRARTRRLHLQLLIRTLPHHPLLLEPFTSTIYIIDVCHVGTGFNLLSSILLWCIFILPIHHLSLCDTRINQFYFIIICSFIDQIWWICLRSKLAGLIRTLRWRMMIHGLQLDRILVDILISLSLLM